MLSLASWTFYNCSFYDNVYLLIKSVKLFHPLFFWQNRPAPFKTQKVLSVIGNFELFSRVFQTSYQFWLNTRSDLVYNFVKVWYITTLSLGDYFGFFDIFEDVFGDFIKCFDWFWTNTNCYSVKEQAENWVKLKNTKFRK